MIAESIDENSCFSINSIPRANQCDFARNTEACTHANTFWEYVPFIACDFNDTIWMRISGYIIVLLFIFLLFIILGTTADSFFCPSLSGIAKALGLSDSLAGVTFLALGNGSTDIFTAIAGVNIGRAEMAICELLGAGVFVITAVVGVIIMTQPFTVDGPEFFRDVLFYLFSISYIQYMISDELIAWEETVGLMSIYVVYISVILIHSLFKRKKSQSDDNTQLQEDIKASDALAGRKAIYYNRQMAALALSEAAEGKSDDGNDVAGIRLKRRQSRIQYQRGSRVGLLMGDRPALRVTDGRMLPPQAVGRLRSVSMTSKLDLALLNERLNILNNAGLKEQVNQEKEGYGGKKGLIWEDGALPSYERPTGLFTEFLYELIPADVEHWPYMPWYLKLNTVLQSPIIFFLKIFIPVVNYSCLNNGWSKLLNTIHCIISPQFAVFAFDLTNLEVATNFPVWMLVLGLGILASVFVFSTSTTSAPPKFHIAFAFLGFMSSIVVIFVVAKEVVNSLFCLGVFLDISEATLGLTILAWGNSIGDLIANTAVAKAGFPKMGFAACIGGPLLNSLLGLGISFTMVIMSTGNDMNLSYAEMIPNCFLFSFLSLLSYLLIFPLLGFQARKSVAMYFFVLYIMFLLYCVLCELSLVHALGKKHRDN